MGSQAEVLHVCGAFFYKMYTDCTRSGGTRSGNVIMVIEVSQWRFEHSHFLLQKQSLCSVSYLWGGATFPSDNIFLVNANYRDCYNVFRT